jgi:hypothetical protein
MRPDESFDHGADVPSLLRQRHINPGELPSGSAQTDRAAGAEDSR